MNSRSTRFSLLLIGLALVALLVLVAGPRPAAADTVDTADWSDGFETYPACPDIPVDCDDGNAEQNTADYFPDPPWTHSGLKDSFVYSDQTHSGAKALKAHGLNHTYGASIAYRQIGDYPPFEIDFWTRVNGDPALLPTAGHMKTVGVELSTGPAYTYNHRGLLSFTVERDPVSGNIVDQEIWGGFLETDEDPASGAYLGDWVGNRWYHVNITFEPVPGDATRVRITWTIDGGTPVSHDYDVKWYENFLDYVGLWAAGGQLWYDDVAITASTTPYSFDTPDAPNLTEKVYLPLTTR